LQFLTTSTYRRARLFVNDRLRRIAELRSAPTRRLNLAESFL
jgi:hypothetical protein